MDKAFTDDAWVDYLWWQANDKRMLKRINALLRDCERHPFEGIGKPEPLKGNYSGYWSRRITEEHRLIYKVDSEAIRIISCKDHYDVMLVPVVVYPKSKVERLKEVETHMIRDGEGNRSESFDDAGELYASLMGK